MIHVQDLSLRRGDKLLFQHASFQIHPGQNVGVTGANGSGKSSLFALILGQLQPDSGEIQYPSRWRIAHVAQEIPRDERPIIEYVLDGDPQLRRLEALLAQAEANDDGQQIAALHAQFEQIGGYQARSRAARLLSGLGFQAQDEQRHVSEFSGGWRMRLNLARALFQPSDLLLLDEPTNHLDLDAVLWLETWLRQYQGTLLLIAHDREFLDAVTDHIAHIEQGRITLHTGNYSAFERQRAESLARQQAAYAKQQQAIAHMRAFITRFRAKATKARQAQSRLKALARMEQIAPAHVDSPFRFQFFPPEKNPTPLLRLDDVSTGYGSQTLLSHIQCSLAPGDRIGLLGPNGAGKTTFIKLLAGQLKPWSGHVETAKDLRIGYFAQHQLEQLHPEHSPLEHLLQLDPQAKEQELRDYLGRFGFVQTRALSQTARFSGGEKARLALALLIYQRPNLLLLDEPTNHLDLAMRQALAVALQDFSGAMIIVSHDRHLLRVCTDQLWLVHQGRVQTFSGDLDDYPQWLAQTRAPVQAKPSRPASRKQQKRQAAAWRQTLAPLKKALEQAERQLEALQAQQHALEQQLADPKLYQTEQKTRLKALLQEKAQLDAQYAAQEQCWLEAAEALEQAENMLPASQAKRK